MAPCPTTDLSMVAGQSQAPEQGGGVQPSGPRHGRLWGEGGLAVLYMAGGEVGCKYWEII